MIPFPFNKNRFSFFVVDHLLVGQLCTNPKSDRGLLSCLKVTQCSTSEIGDAPLYNSCSLPIQVMTTRPLPALSKCKSELFNVPRVMKTKFPATVLVFGVVSSEGHIMTRRRPTSSKRLRLCFRRSATTLYPRLPTALVEKSCSQFRICIEALIEAEGGYIE